MKMNETEKVALYGRAWTLWNDLQFIMFFEEAAEAQQALSKVFRKGPTEERLDKLAEELADLTIVMEQLNCVFPELKERIPHFKQEKLARLKQLVEKGLKEYKEANRVE